jgi:hypothetical protein
LAGLTSGLRTERSGRNASEVALEMLTMFKRSDLFNISRGDFTQLGEKMQFNTALLQQQASQMYTTNATTGSQIIEAFGRGGVDDQRLLDYTNQINNAITNPSNEFTKAFIFRSLRKRNPNMSMMELMERQEQGIFGAGTMGQIMDDLRGAYSGDALTLATSQAFGLKIHQAKRVLSMDPESLNNIGSAEELQNVMSVEEGEGGVGVMSRRMAQMNNWFSKGGIQAVQKIDEYITAFEEGGVGGLMSSISSDIANALSSGFDIVADRFAERMSTELGALWSDQFDLFGNKKKESGERAQRELYEGVLLPRMGLEGSMEENMILPDGSRGRRENGAANFSDLSKQFIQQELMQQFYFNPINRNLGQYDSNKSGVIEQNEVPMELQKEMNRINALKDEALLEILTRVTQLLEKDTKLGFGEALNQVYSTY